MSGLLALGIALSVAVGPSSAVDVQWNKGGGPAQMAKGLPNPPGWYKAAVGPRTSQRVLYLTFDDGPSRFTPRLLKALKKSQARATFFVAGGYAEANPKVIRRMHSGGHAVGNHTWWHPRLTDVSTAKVHRELASTNRALGSFAAPCMRPPYGLINQRVAKTSIALGLQPVLWTAHIEDWQPHSFDWTVQRLKRETTPGAVILMHDTHSQTVAAVAKMLPVWVKRGYSMEPVPVCE